MFAKLYNDTKYGQILIKQDEGHEGVQIEISFKPEGVGVCTVTMSNANLPEEEQWEWADKVFGDMTEESAVKSVSAMYESLNVEPEKS